MVTLQAGRDHIMEKRGDNLRPLALQMLGAGIIVAGSALLLPTLDFAMRVLARWLGVMIGEAVAVSLRALFSGLGVFLPQHSLPETRLPSSVNPFHACLTDASKIVAAIQASEVANRIAGIDKRIKKDRAR
jgi:hypothetical protein